jgi:hypothetical protein
MSFNPNLTFFLERLAGVSTNVFRLETQNKTTATSSDIITIDIPSNAIVNLKSLKIWANANANVVAGKGARLPPINDLVERVEVSFGGIVVSQGTNFSNVLQEAQRAIMEESVDSVVGHPEYVRAKSYVNSAVFANTENENYTPPAGVTYFCIDKFPGFFDTAAPSLCDLSILPDCRIRCYMASDNVLSTGATVTLGTAANNFASVVAAPTAGNSFAVSGARYQLTDIHATIECIGLSDMTYDAMLSAQMSQQGFLEIPYKAYTTFQETHTGSSRFTVSTACLDRVWVAWREGTYDSQRTPHIVDGHKSAGAFVSSATIADTSTAGAVDLDIGKPQYDVGGVLDTNSEKYRGHYFNFKRPATNMKAQLQLNGAMYPNFSADLTELYGITKNSLPMGKVSKKMTMGQYLNNYCINCFRLNLPDSEFSRTLSGLDLRATNLQGILRTQNAGTSANVTIFTEQTEVLRAGPSRTIEILS